MQKRFSLPASNSRTAKSGRAALLRSTCETNAHAAGFGAKRRALELVGSLQGRAPFAICFRRKTAQLAVSLKLRHFAKHPVQNRLPLQKVHMPTVVGFQLVVQLFGSGKLLYSSLKEQLISVAVKA